MKIYIVMVDDSEYHDGSYHPEAAFTDEEIAEMYGKATTNVWGDYLVEECEIDATDIFWIVTSEEAYSRGEVSFRKAFLTKDEAKAYAKEINEDTNHVLSTFFHADVEEVHINKDIEKVKTEYDEMMERTRYHGKFMPGDKVRMLSLDEILSMDGVEKQRDKFGTDMIKNTNFHIPVWICLADKLTEQMGKSFIIEKTVGDCVVTPNGMWLQEWMFIKE